MSSPPLPRRFQSPMSNTSTTLMQLAARIESLSQNSPPTTSVMASPAWSPQSAQMRSEGLFDAIDTNGDGVVSR